jgi:arsenate reductase
MAIVLWGIPTCGTVKKARAALAAAGVPFVDRDLREDPPSRAEVERAIAALGAKALRNTSGASYRALPAAKDAWSDAQWRDAFVGDPMLLKRPVFVKNGDVVAVGFRDDAVLEKLRGA